MKTNAFMRCSIISHKPFESEARQHESMWPRIYCKGCLPLVRHRPLEVESTPWPRCTQESVVLRRKRVETFLHGRLEPYSYDPESLGRSTSFQDLMWSSFNSTVVSKVFSV